MAETVSTDGNDASLDDNHLVMEPPTGTNADTSMISSTSSSKGAGVVATSLGSGQASPFNNKISTTTTATTTNNEPVIPTTPTTPDIGNFISSIVANLNNSSNSSKATAGSRIANNSTIPSVSYPGMMMMMTRTTTNDNNSFAAEAAAPGAPTNGTNTKVNSDIIINTSNFDMTMMSPMSPSITSVSSPMVTNNSVYMSNSLISNNNNIIQEEDLDHANNTMDAHTEEQEKEDQDAAEFVEVMMEDKPEKSHKNIAINHDSSDEESELTGENYNDNNDNNSVKPLRTNDDKVIVPIISASGSGTGGTYNSETSGNYMEKGTMTSFINSDSGSTDRRNGSTTKRCRPVWWLWCLALLVLVLAAVVAVIVVLDHRNSSSSSTTTSSGAASEENAPGTTITNNIPTLAPTLAPTNSPSMTPTTSPSSRPTQSPSIVPTNQPSSSPTFAPTLAPTVTAMPSDSPSDTPSDFPSDVPSLAPTFPPSIWPSDAPSDIPTLVPTDSPSIWPSDAPSDIPSLTPTDLPSISPTAAPTITAAPTVSPAPTLATYFMLAEVLGNSTLGVTPMEVLHDPTTPQGRAVMWMTTEDTVISDILQSSSSTTATDADGGVTVTAVVVVSADNATANLTRPTVSELTPPEHDVNPFVESSAQIQQRFAVVALDMALHDGMDIVWSFPDLHECEWPGIKCNSDEEIIEINWARQDLSGFVAPELALLTSLERLDLAENQLTGFVDVFWTVPSLEKLYLFSNQFMGSIGTEIGQMSNLEHLYLFKNKLTGTIPESLFDDLDKLRYLILSFNQFEGGLPDRIRMPQLYYFDLSFNNLGGTLPDNLNMPVLKHFHMDHNGFTGTIPGDYSNLGSNRLLQFYLNDNNLVGGFPSGWENKLPHKFLTNVDVSNNNLNQKIPGSVCALSVYDEGETVEFRADCPVCDCNPLCYRWCSGKK